MLASQKPPIVDLSPSLNVMRVRPAVMGDAQMLHDWANDPDTRRWSFNTDLIAWESHVSWLAGVLENRDRMMYVGEQDGPVGSVRFDRKDGVSEVSITVAPSRRGDGLARTLLHAALAEYSHRPVVARVKVGNERSMRLFADWQSIDHGVFLYEAGVGRV